MSGTHSITSVDHNYPVNQQTPSCYESSSRSETHAMGSYLE